MQAQQHARLATLVGYFGLLILTVLWVTILSPPQRISTSVVLVIFVGPLLLPLRGLLYGKPLTHTWTTFLALLYFMHGVVEAWANPAERWLAIAEIVLSILLFFGCFYFVRACSKKAADSAIDTV